MAGLGSVTALYSWVTTRLVLRSEKGATAVEYGLMVALIAATIFAAVIFLGQQTRDSLNCAGTSIRSGAAC